ncbi:MAG: lysylphosphatidylglycerol synthase transmembrane domain-containing protein [Maioricimonas sp. JB049]
MSKLPSSGRNPARRLWHFRQVLPGLLGLALLVAVLSRVQFDQLADVVGSADPLWLAIVLLAGALTSLGRAWRYAILTPPNRMTLSLFACFATMRGLNLAMPFRVGEVASLALLKRYGHSASIAQTLPIWIFLRLTDVVALGLCGLLLFGAHDVGHYGLPSGSQIAIVLVVAVSGLALVSMYLVPRFRVPKMGNGWLAHRLLAVQEGLHDLPGVGRVIGGVLLSVGIWIGLLLATIAAQKTIHIPFDFDRIAVAGLCSLFVGLLPIHAPGAIGTGDALWCVVLTTLGLPLAEAATFAFSIRMLLLLSLAFDTLTGILLLRRYTPCVEIRLQPTKAASG